MRTKNRYILVVTAAALLSTAHAQFNQLAGPEPNLPDALLQSRVSLEGDPDYDLNVSKFIADITDRLGECDRIWNQDELVFVLECLAFGESGDLLLQFWLDWYPRQSIARLVVIDGFDGVPYQSASEVLRNLPMTVAELEIRGELEYRWQLFRERFDEEYSSHMRAYREHPNRYLSTVCHPGTRANSVYLEIDEYVRTSGDQLAESIDSIIGATGANAELFDEYVARIELLLTEWALVRHDCIPND